MKRWEKWHIIWKVSTKESVKKYYLSFVQVTSTLSKATNSMWTSAAAQDPKIFMKISEHYLCAPGPLL